MRNVLFLSFVLIGSVFAMNEWDIVGKFNNFSCSLVENPNEKFLRMDHGEIREVICTNLPGEELFNYRSENDLFKAHFINCKKDKSLFKFDSYQNIDFIFEKCGEYFWNNTFTAKISKAQNVNHQNLSLTFMENLTPPSVSFFEEILKEWEGNIKINELENSENYQEMLKEWKNSKSYPLSIQINGQEL